MSLEGRYWGEYCLTSLLTTWTLRPRVPSASAQMIANWQGVVDTQEGRAAIQGALDRRLGSGLAGGDLMKFYIGMLRSPASGVE